MVVRRVWVTGVTASTVYLVLVLVEPPRLNGTIATIFLGVRAIRRTVAAVASHTCLSPYVSVIVTKLAEFRVQTATHVNKGVSAVSERVRVFVAIEAMPPVFSEGSGAGGGREKGAPERRVVGLKRGANGENLRRMMFYHNTSTSTKYLFICP